MRLTATHVSDGVGQVDVWETTLGVELFSDIDFGASSASTDVLAASYDVGLDTDNDGAADVSYQPLDLTGYEGAPVNVFAYNADGVQYLFVSAPYWGAYWNVWQTLEASTTVTGSSTPALAITDASYDSSTGADVGTPVYDAITQSTACIVVDVTVDVDISHTWKGDLEVNLWAPDGTMVALHDRTGGSADDIIGSYASDGSGTLTPAGDLSDFVLVDGAGDWTLEITDNVSLDTGTLNSWGITLGCL